MKDKKSTIKGEDILEFVLFFLSFCFLIFVGVKCTKRIRTEAERYDQKHTIATVNFVNLPERKGAQHIYTIKHLKDTRTPKERTIDLYKSYAKDIGEELDLDPLLILAVVETESRYTADICGNGTVGLMQLIPVCHVQTMNKYEYSVQDLYDPYKNMRVGATYLATLVHKYDDIPFALVCYNKGEGGALASGSRSSYYSDSVMTVYNRMLGGDIYGTGKG